METQEEPVIRTFFIDDAGKNKLLIKHTDKTITVFIHLESEGTRKRKIGVVTKSTKTISIFRTREEHLFRQGNAYGFNEYVIRNQTSFDKISLFDGVEYWKFTVDFLLKNGKYLMFKEQGFERQLFLSLEQLAPYKIKDKENRRL